MAYLLLADDKAYSWRRYAAAVGVNGNRPRGATTELKPWVADPSWHPARRGAFECYRDMGAERSTAKVARALGKSKTLMDRWSGQDGWPARAGAWDAELDLRRREEFAAATVDVSRDQAETAAKIRLGVDAFAQSFLADLEVYCERGEDPFADLTPSQKLAKLGAAARALQHAQQVERLARGLSTENVAGHAGTWPIPPEIERKSVEELEAYPHVGSVVAPGAEAVLHGLAGEPIVARPEPRFEASRGRRATRPATVALDETR